MTDEIKEAEYFLKRAYDEIVSARGCIDRGFPQHQRSTRWDEMTSILNQIQQKITTMQFEQARRRIPTN